MIGLCVALVVLVVMVVSLPVYTTKEIQNGDAIGAWVGGILFVMSAWGLVAVVQAIAHAG